MVISSVLSFRSHPSVHSVYSTGSPSGSLRYVFRSRWIAMSCASARSYLHPPGWIPLLSVPAQRAAERPYSSSFSRSSSPPPAAPICRLRWCVRACMRVVAGEEEGGGGGRGGEARRGEEEEEVVEEEEEEATTERHSARGDGGQQPVSAYETVPSGSERFRRLSVLVPSSRRPLPMFAATPSTAPDRDFRDSPSSSVASFTAATVSCTVSDVSVCAEIVASERASDAGDEHLRVGKRGRCARWHSNDQPVSICRHCFPHSKLMLRTAKQRREKRSVCACVCACVCVCVCVRARACVCVCVGGYYDYSQLFGGC